MSSRFSCILKKMQSNIIKYNCQKFILHRMYDIFKRTKRGSSNESGRKLVYVQHEKPSKAEKTPASNKSLRKILKTSMPSPKPILRNPLVIPQKSMPSRSNRSPREVQIHNSYPGGVRVIRLNQDHAKPMLVYRPGPPRPTYTQSHLPNTVPHLRLGDYRPKMVNGYFSPNNVRSMMDDFPVNSDTSFNSSEYFTTHVFMCNTYILRSF